MIEARHLTKVYRVAKPVTGRFASLRALFHTEYAEKRAVDDVSFTIRDGEIVGYIGPNGAGKSTTIKMLSGILVPTAGEVAVNGLKPDSDRRRHLANIGVVFGQKSSLWWDVPVIDSLNILKEMYRVDDARFKRNLAAFTDLLDMGPFLNQPVRQLSLGQRVRADLAAALMHDPGVLFLDEPTIGVDVVAKERLRQFILEINRQRGVTALLTTHDMVDMEKLVSRVIVIYGGKAMYDGPIQGLRERYGQERQVIIQFAEQAPALEIPGVEIRAVDPFKLRFKFRQREMTAGEVIAKVSGLPHVIRDISIQETDIEQIVRNLYENGLAREGEAG
ncbi:MAG TPA: ATP-binding cassette domain-containing protein [Clostridia bacterium]|nr:ATP-binding cassette domain-containing protein [Clostridia bacterium]